LIASVFGRNLGVTGRFFVRKCEKAFRSLFEWKKKLHIYKRSKNREKISSTVVKGCVYCCNYNW